MYEKIISVLLVLILSLSLFSVSVFAGGIEYLDADAVAVEIRDQMKQRKTDVSVYYKTEVPNMALVATQLIEEYADIFVDVFAHTGDPCEGDYLFYQSLVSRAPVPNLNLPATPLGGKLWGSKVDFVMSYRTTAEQEAWVSTRVSEVLAELALDGKSEFEKVSAIYNWIKDNVEYDFVGLANYLTEPIVSTAYAALHDGKAVCQGYSVLFYRMCLESGIDARVVQDVTGGGAPHVWNIVRVDGDYYYIDTTLGAGVEQKLSGDPDAFFLKGSNYWSTLPLYTLGDQYTNPTLYPDFAVQFPVSAGDYTAAGHEHSLKHISAKNATTLSSGNIEYWQCESCHRCYTDADATDEVSLSDTATSFTDDGTGKTSFFSFIVEFFARIMNFLRSLLPF